MAAAAESSAPPVQPRRGRGSAGHAWPGRGSPRPPPPGAQRPWARLPLEPEDHEPQRSGASSPPGAPASARPPPRLLRPTEPDWGRPGPTAAGTGSPRGGREPWFPEAERGDQWQAGPACAPRAPGSPAAQGQGPAAPEQGRGSPHSGPNTLAAQTRRKGAPLLQSPPSCRGPGGRDSRRDSAQGAAGAPRAEPPRPPPAPGRGPHACTTAPTQASQAAPRPSRLPPPADGAGAASPPGQMGLRPACTAAEFWQDTDDTHGAQNPHGPARRRRGTHPDPSSKETHAWPAHMGGHASWISREAQRRPWRGPTSLPQGQLPPGWGVGAALAQGSVAGKVNPLGQGLGFEPWSPHVSEWTSN